MVVVGIGVGHDGRREAGRGVQDLGVHAVAIHLLDAGGRVPAAAAHLVEAHPALLVLGLQAGAGVHAEVDRILDALDDPGVALVEVLHPGRPVAKRRRHPLHPEVRRLVDMTVGRDQPVTPARR